MLHAQGMMDLLLELNVRVGLRQIWEWLSETQRVRLHRSSYITSFSTWLLTLMALSVTSVVLNETQGEATTARLYGAERRLLGGRANS